MDGSRFDDLARSLARPRTRRGFFGGLAGLAATVAAGRATGVQAACSPEEVYQRGIGCVCRTTGRPRGNNFCPCPKGLARCDDVCVKLASDPTNCGGCGNVCDDGNPCTRDHCRDGVCRHPATSCDDGDACTTDTCDSVTGCVHTPISCDDSDACTTDTCDPATGCVYTPVVCNDGNACTTDTCDPATGCVYTPVVCNDGNACTTDTCDPATGCVYTPVADGQPGGCPTGDVCCTGVCTTGSCVTCLALQDTCTSAGECCAAGASCTTIACGTPGNLCCMPAGGACPSGDACDCCGTLNCSSQVCG